MRVKYLAQVDPTVAALLFAVPCCFKFFILLPPRNSAFQTCFALRETGKILAFVAFGRL